MDVFRFLHLPSTVAASLVLILGLFKNLQTCDGESSSEYLASVEVVKKSVAAPVWVSIIEYGLQVVTSLTLSVFGLVTIVMPQAVLFPNDVRALQVPVGDTVVEPSPSPAGVGLGVLGGLAPLPGEKAMPLPNTRFLLSNKTVSCLVALGIGFYIGFFHIYIHALDLDKVWFLYLGRFILFVLIWSFILKGMRGKIEWVLMSSPQAILLHYEQRLDMERKQVERQYAPKAHYRLKMPKDYPSPSVSGDVRAYQTQKSPSPNEPSPAGSHLSLDRKLASSVTKTSTKGSAPKSANSFLNAGSFLAKPLSFASSRTPSAKGSILSTPGTSGSQVSGTSGIALRESSSGFRNRSQSFLGKNNNVRKAMEGALDDTTRLSAVLLVGVYLAFSYVYYVFPWLQATVVYGYSDGYTTYAEGAGRETPRCDESLGMCFYPAGVVIIPEIILFLLFDVVFLSAWSKAVGHYAARTFETHDRFYTHVNLLVTDAIRGISQLARRISENQKGPPKEGQHKKESELHEELHHDEPANTWGPNSCLDDLKLSCAKLAIDQRTYSLKNLPFPCEREREAYVDNLNDASRKGSAIGGENPTSEDVKGIREQDISLEQCSEQKVEASSGDSGHAAELETTAESNDIPESAKRANASNATDLESSPFDPCGTIREDAGRRQSWLSSLLLGDYARLFDNSDVAVMHAIIESELSRIMTLFESSESNVESETHTDKKKDLIDPQVIDRLQLEESVTSSGAAEDNHSGDHRQREQETRCHREGELGAAPRDSPGGAGAHLSITPAESATKSPSGSSISQRENSSNKPQVTISIDRSLFSSTSIGGSSEIHRVRGMVYFNFCFDLVRFVFGRVLLLNMQHFYVCIFLMLMRDVLFELFHFAHGYSSASIMTVLRDPRRQYQILHHKGEHLVSKKKKDGWSPGGGDRRSARHSRNSTDTPPGGGTPSSGAPQRTMSQRISMQSNRSTKLISMQSNIAPRRSSSARHSIRSQKSNVSSEWDEASGNEGDFEHIENTKTERFRRFLENFLFSESCGLKCICFQAKRRMKGGRLSLDASGTADRKSVRTWKVVFPDMSCSWTHTVDYRRYNYLDASSRLEAILRQKTDDGSGMGMGAPDAAVGGPERNFSFGRQPSILSQDLAQKMLNDNPTDIVAAFCFCNMRLAISNLPTSAAALMDPEIDSPMVYEKLLFQDPEEAMIPSSMSMHHATINDDGGELGVGSTNRMTFSVKLINDGQNNEQNDGKWRQDGDNSSPMTPPSRGDAAVNTVGGVRSVLPDAVSHSSGSKPPAASSVARAQNDEGTIADPIHLPPAEGSQFGNRQSRRGIQSNVTPDFATLEPEPIRRPIIATVTPVFAGGRDHSRSFIARHDSDIYSVRGGPTHGSNKHLATNESQFSFARRSQSSVDGVSFMDDQPSSRRPSNGPGSRLTSKEQGMMKTTAQRALSAGQSAMSSMTRSESRTSSYNVADKNGMDEAAMEQHRSNIMITNVLDGISSALAAVAESKSPSKIHSKNSDVQHSGKAAAPSPSENLSGNLSGTALSHDSSNERAHTNYKEVIARTQGSNEDAKTPSKHPNDAAIEKTPSKDSKEAEKQIAAAKTPSKDSKQGENQTAAAKTPSKNSKEGEKQAASAETPSNDSGAKIHSSDPKEGAAAVAKNRSNSISSVWKLTKTESGILRRRSIDSKRSSTGSSDGPGERKGIIREQKNPENGNGMAVESPQNSTKKIKEWRDKIDEETHDKNPMKDVSPASPTEPSVVQRRPPHEIPEPGSNARPRNPAGGHASDPSSANSNGQNGETKANVENGHNDGFPSDALKEVTAERSHEDTGYLTQKPTPPYAPASGTSQKAPSFVGSPAISRSGEKHSSPSGGSEKRVPRLSSGISATSLPSLPEDSQVWAQGTQGQAWGSSGNDKSLGFIQENAVDQYEISSGSKRNSMRKQTRGASTSSLERMKEAFSFGGGADQVKNFEDQKLSDLRHIENEAIVTEPPCNEGRRPQRVLSVADKKQLELVSHIVDITQTHIAIRYQGRIAAKIFAQILLMVAPFIFGLMDTKYAPGFVDPVEHFDSDDNPSASLINTGIETKFPYPSLPFLSHKYFNSVILFIVIDVLLICFVQLALDVEFRRYAPRKDKEAYWRTVATVLYAKTVENFLILIGRRCRRDPADLLASQEGLEWLFEANRPTLANVLEQIVTPYSCFYTVSAYRRILFMRLRANFSRSMPFVKALVGFAMFVGILHLHGGFDSYDPAKIQKTIMSLRLLPVPNRTSIGKIIKDVCG